MSASAANTGKMLKAKNNAKNSFIVGWGECGIWSIIAQNRFVSGRRVALLPKF
jgi:hypothetical protein